MKLKPVKRLIVLAVFLIAVVAFWLFEGSLRAQTEIYIAMRAIENFEVEATPSKKNIGSETYTHEVASDVIRTFYHRAAEKVAARGGEVRTLAWQDAMGWPRVSTVLITTSGYLEVGAAMNNDNDSVFVHFRPEEFDRPGAKDLPSYHLPDGILRRN